MTHLLILATFVILFVRDMIAQPLLGEVPPLWVAGSSLGLMAMAWLTAHLVIWRQQRRMERFGQMRALRRADKASSYLRVGAVLLHAFNVLALGWLDVVRGTIGNILIVDELVAIAPVVIVFALSWWSMYPIERRLREAVMLRDLNDGFPARPIPSRFAFVLSPMRHSVALVLLPITLILTWSELVELTNARYAFPVWLPAQVLQFIGMAAVVTMMPLLMRRVWDTAALAPGPLRSQITAMCLRHRVRVRELLLWRTHNTMVNGAVMGFAWPFRYILLTDALLEHLHPRQVEAVTAHEIAHVRLRHMPWLIAGAFGAVIVATVALQLSLSIVAGQWLGPETIGTSAAVGALILGLALFGYASRRFEWQADAFAAQHLSGYCRGQPRPAEPITVTPEAAEAMSSALDAVARLNHIRREKFTWRHGSIASRQRRLKALVGARADRLKADRDALLVKTFSAMALLGAFCLIVTDLIVNG